LISVLLLLSMLTAPADVTIDADTIYLGALVRFPAADARASIVLGYAPNPGLARRISRSEILGKVASEGKTAGDLQLPDSILVHRRAAGPDRDQVTRAILDSFVKRFPAANVEITSVDIPNVQIGTGAVDVTATLPARLDPEAAVFVRVELRGTSFAKTIFVRTRVRVEAEQPVLRNSVEAHTEVQPSDIELKMMPVHSGAAPEQIEGMVAKRDLEPGQVLTSDLLYQPTYVHKGDTVTVKAAAGAVIIAASMRAKATGKLGDIIPVEHLSGEGSAMARIVGPKILEVSK
jgi:flagella basal body P-ring formation protein FlgA